MASSNTDKVFAGSIPKVYEAYLVPLLFAPYAPDLANRLAARSPNRVLELAAGTGVVTRALASVLPEAVSIVATDLNQPMLDHAAALGTKRPVEWRQADAMQLPFPDESFDAVVCQFGVMFFPDKRRAFAEARRVLRPGGGFVFNTWDRLEHSEFEDTVTAAVAALFPQDPPRFFARTPHGYHDVATIENDLRAAGFDTPPDVVTVAARRPGTHARPRARRDLRRLSQQSGHHRVLAIGRRAARRSDGSGFRSRVPGDHAGSARVAGVHRPGRAGELEGAGTGLAGGLRRIPGGRRWPRPPSHHRSDARPAGARDAFVTRADQDALVSAVAGSRLMIYERAGHALHWEEPERFASDVVAFVESLTGDEGR